MTLYKFLIFWIYVSTFWFSPRICMTSKAAIQYPKKNNSLSDQSKKGLTATPIDFSMSIAVFTNTFCPISQKINSRYASWNSNKYSGFCFA